MTNWKLDKVRILLTHFNEPMLNLHFLNPYLKSNASVFTYQLLLKVFHHNSEEDNNKFIHKVCEYLGDYKKKLYE